MVLLSVLEKEAETKLKAGLSNHRALMMEMEDKLGWGVPRGLFSRWQTRLRARAEVLYRVLPASVSAPPLTITSADPINHRNELLRTPNTPRSGASTYWAALLSNERFISYRTHSGTLPPSPELLFTTWLTASQFFSSFFPPLQFSRSEQKLLFS